MQSRSNSQQNLPQVRQPALNDSVYDNISIDLSASNLSGLEKFLSRIVSNKDGTNQIPNILAQAKSALDTLLQTRDDPRIRLLLLCRLGAIYGRALTQKETGEILGLKRSRVGSLEQEIIKKLSDLIFRAPHTPSSSDQTPPTTTKKIAIHIRPDVAPHRQLIEKTQNIYISRPKLLSNLHSSRQASSEKRWLRDLIATAPKDLEWNQEYQLNSPTGIPVRARFRPSNIFDKISLLHEGEAISYLNFLRSYSDAAAIHQKLQGEGYAVSEKACYKAIKAVTSLLADTPMDLYRPYVIRYGSYHLGVISRPIGSGSPELALRSDDWVDYISDLYPHSLQVSTSPSVDMRYINASQLTRALLEENYPVSKKTLLRMFSLLGSKIPSTYPLNRPYIINTETFEIPMIRTLNNSGISYQAEVFAMRTYLNAKLRFADARVLPGFLSCDGTFNKMRDEGFAVEKADIIEFFNQWSKQSQRPYSTFATTDGINAATVYDRKNKTDSLYAEFTTARTLILATLNPITTEELAKYLSIRNVAHREDFSHIANCDRKIRAYFHKTQLTFPKFNTGQCQQITDGGDCVRLYLKNETIQIHQDDLPGLRRLLAQK